ncbi:Endoglucanase 3 [Hordeum vulgare]|nr:Endoglucanase 3 [Hordeum vulgare]
MPSVHTLLLADSDDDNENIPLHQFMVAPSRHVEEEEYETEQHNSCEGVHEVHAIEYFIEGCRDGTILKHKLMCSEPATLAQLMAQADKYAMADCARRIKVTATGKASPLLATPRSAAKAGDSRTTSGRPTSRIPSTGASRSPPSRKSSRLL